MKERFVQATAEIKGFLKRKKTIILLSTLATCVLIVAIVLACVSDNILYLAGIFISILGIAIVWGLTMIAYFWARKNWSHSKYGVEAVFIAVVLVIGAIIGLHWFAIQGGETESLESGATSAFASFYSAIGKLLFEGMDEITDPILAPLFSGWAIYAGITFVSIVTAKANYELFSRARLFLREKGRDIYVFTALTEETLEIAQSLEEKFAYNEKGERKNFKKRPKIIFAGPSLAPFDRKDELCRRVMANNFIYWSFVTDKDKKKDVAKKSIAEMLHLNNDNYKKYEQRFVIFAFASKNHTPCEEDNMDLVISDVKTRMANGNDNMRIEYYILTKRNINYEAYDYKNRELMYEYYEHNKKSFSFDKVTDDELKKNILSSKIDQTAYKSERKKIQEEYFNRFVINVWSEATAIAKDATIKASKFLSDKMKEAWDKKLPSANNDVADLNVWCLGFGPTAQAIAKAIYCQSSYINKSGNASVVKIEAFDKEMDSIAGLYQKEHPLGIYIDDNATKSQIDAKRQKLNYNRFGWEFELYSLANKEMSYPIYQFHKEDCRSEAFINKLDNAIGKRSKYGANSNDSSGNEQPDIFIVATGDDYNNIRVANALIQDTINETVKGDDGKEQILFVNIWDEKNNDLLLTCGGAWGKGETHQKLTIKYGEQQKSTEQKSTEQKLTVFIIGNNKKIYVPDIIDINAPSDYNKNYERIRKTIEAVDQNIDKDFMEARHRVFLAGETASDDEGLALEPWLNSIKIAIVDDEEPEEIAIADNAAKKTIADVKKENVGVKAASIPQNGENKIEEYNKLEIWLKESNAQAALYQLILGPKTQRAEEILLKDPTKRNDYFKEYRRLAMMEHQRWCRAHIMAGWEYKNLSEKRELLRQHPSIIPYVFVKTEHYFYDMINVLMTRKKEQRVEIKR